MPTPPHPEGHAPGCNGQEHTVREPIELLQHRTTSEAIAAAITIMPAQHPGDLEDLIIALAVALVAIAGRDHTA